MTDFPQQPTGEPHTIWRIRALDLISPARLNVRLAVDTTAPLVVEAIERAADDAGILLERIEEPA
jgi:hypothetical protein